MNAPINTALLNVDFPCWFKSSKLPITAIAHVLSELKDRGSLDPEMAEALEMHAQNFVQVLPLHIASLGRVMALAAREGHEDMQKMGWIVELLGELLHGASELESAMADQSAR